MEDEIEAGLVESGRTLLDLGDAKVKLIFALGAKAFVFEV